MTIESAERALDKAFLAMSKELEILALRAVKRLALKHPKRTVSFVSGMGQFNWDVDDDEVFPAENETWVRLLSMYGNRILPTVRFTARNGKITRETNW